MSSDGLKERNVYLTRLLEKAGVDAAQSEVAKRVQDVLTEELHHRMKNVLAMVTAIVRQSMRSAPNLRVAEDAITRRLLALGKAHDLLLQANWKSAPIIQVIQGAIDQYHGNTKRIHIQGPDTDITADSILPLTLIFNELCTNAVKYGALSNEDGRVRLNWARDDDKESMMFHWLECDGPPVSPPKVRSFGSRLVEDALPRQLGGKGQLDFASSGVSFVLTVPLEKLRPLV